MAYMIDVRNISGGNKNVQIDKYPDECPICHTSVYPKFFGMTAYLTRPIRIQSVFQCTKHECGQLFIGTYNKSEGTFFLVKVEPIYPQPKTFPPEILNISPADRRKFKDSNFKKPERRSKQDRRSGKDRRTS